MRSATTFAPPSPASDSATLAPVGPAYQANYNPLTGLPLDPDQQLDRTPFLVAITNFPPSSRPQTGLSLADHVWESSIAQGQTRFLAVYYGVEWNHFEGSAAQRNLPYDHLLGPVRSGRVVFEDIRSFYPGALLITRAASPEILPELNRQFTMFNKDPQDVNSAGLTYQEILELPLETASAETYAGLHFDPEVPPGGVSAPDLTVIYNQYAQYSWVFEESSQRYTRLQAPFGSDGPMSPLIDRLTGQPLQFDNLVVLFAQHKFENLAATILEIEMRFVPERYGLLFRNGQVYEIRWSSRRNEFRLLDEAGQDFPLRPGTTFYEVVSFRSTWNPETRVLRYHQPPLPTLTPSATPTPTTTPTPTRTATPTPTPP